MTGVANVSNVAAVSPNPDSGGSRTVSAAYVEFAVPLFGRDRVLPLVRGLEFQLAGRYENYKIGRAHV